MAYRGKTVGRKRQDIILTIYETNNSRSHIMRLLTAKVTLLLTVSILMSGCFAPRGASLPSAKAESKTSFTLAVIPDTQNYLDYTHQKDAGFAFDASSLFIQQMNYLASHSKSTGGDIAFVASVGDVWQHQTKKYDVEHQLRGIHYTPNPIIEPMVKVTPETISIEMSKAIEGYKILSDANLPFGVAPGNHDYDAIWTTKKFPPNLNKPKNKLKMIPEDIGVLHVGGLDNFRSVFGSNSSFFKTKHWYIGSHRGGASSAQIFTAAGYKFLHIALEMHPGDEVISWAQSVIAQNPNLPTIFTTHDHLNVEGERKGDPVLDLATVDPKQHNNAQAVWDKLFSQHPQVLMVLSGHQLGQSYRVDSNIHDQPVIQILADYQARQQVSKDNMTENNMSKPTSLGDGWLRLIEFDLQLDNPTISVKTYSSFYGKYSGEIEHYADWYKQYEHPKLSDSEFRETDDFILKLDGFHDRFRDAKEH